MSSSTPDPRDARPLNYAAGALARWATPERELAWDGDPHPPLVALEAATRVLTAEGIEHSTTVNLKFADGEQQEDSISAAREALRFAQRPSVVNCWATAATPDSYPPISWVRATPGAVVISARSQDFDLADKLVEVAVEAYQSGVLPPAPVSSQPDPVDKRTPTRSGIGGWVESHQGLIAVVGIAVAAVVAIVIAIAAG